MDARTVLLHFIQFRERSVSTGKQFEQAIFTSGNEHIRASWEITYRPDFSTEIGGTITSNPPINPDCHGLQGMMVSMNLAIPNVRKVHMTSINVE
jgi:hypothetical protein